ncbi:hypothetical protein [Amycolatopsis alkalitolerans]|uniref:Uncharacterized protein n=1 Tax=Amycolatopsis alkalitolerans TaxID=2547244 RepID=A0A5C4M168_9PSEU|nr:hypothetical protein [Amycolatopsis alkalitolerans]TNC25088.1 hypothetical protein FG385_15690 [Amycolatopsis alkalitolerans]
MIDALGDVGAALKHADPDDLEHLDEKLNVQLQYEPKGRTVIASVRPRVVSACDVRSGPPPHPGAKMPVCDVIK